MDASGAVLVQEIPTAAPLHPALADVDGDGDTELALLSDLGLEIYEHVGGSWVLNDLAPFAGLHGTWSLLSGEDLTGDGLDDLAVFSTTEMQVFSYDGLELTLANH